MGVIVKDSNRQHKFLSILFVVAIPVFLITLNVTWVVNDLRFYENGFRNNNISLTTGIGEEDLSVVAQGIRGYFNSFDEPLSIRTKIFGNERELFNSREIIHMRDVKHLIWGVYILGSVAAIYITGNIAVGFLILGPGYGSILCNLTIRGAIATIGFVAVIGITALLGFEDLFRIFHQISFRNDFWILNPSTDFLLMMFPQKFWFDTTLFLGAIIMGEATVLGGAASVTIFGIRSKRRI